MKKALNKYGKLVDIIESIKEETYICPVCKEELIRNFGISRQYFSHPNGRGDECELKLKLMVKDGEKEFDEKEIDILNREYYNKTFDDVNIELSDYMSEEGYYLTQEQKDIIFAEEDRIKIAALAGCVDCETEYFNGSGWVKISEYKNNDRVLQFTNEWKAELVNPLEYIKLPCDKMTRYKTKYGIDMVLSDEHNVLYIDTSHNHHNYWKNVNLLKIKENEMRARHIKNKSGFTGKFLTTFDYDGSYSTGLSENELRLTIAIMADGNYRSDGNSHWCRMNLKKDYKKDRLRWLLKECNIEYNENKWNNTDDKYINICFYSPLKLKHLPKEWYDLNKFERKIIFDEIRHWDGDNGLGNRGIRYRTTSKEDVDFIQFIISSLGKRVTINIDTTREIGDKYILSTNGKEYTRKSILYTINVVNSNNIVSMGQQSDINNKNNVISEYITTDGYKYCFTVPSGMLVLRRNNKIFITGNSAKTSTLYYYAKEHQSKRILYLVYNKSMVDACASTFGKLSNTEIRTIHSLGYYYCGKFYKNKLTFNYSVVDIIKDLNLNWNKDMEIAVKVDKMMKEYSLSDALEFSDIDLFKDNDGNTTDEREEIISLCNKLWNLKKEYKNNIKITHDDYLKMFHLEHKRLDNKYDIIMLDECLPQSQLVKTDQGNISIKQLYDWYIQGNILPKVLSFNIYTDTFEYKDITWAKKSENRQLLEIKTNINNLQCTENHKILTHRGYVRADNLIPGRDMLILDEINQYTYNYVKSIKTIYNEDVYDIEVKDNHNFITVRENNNVGVVVHNCQDSSLLVLDILKSSNVPGIVIVGDRFQQLYSWRKATNIMPLFDAKEYKLTTSFRISQNTANIANMIIKDICKVDINMKGFNTKQKIVNEIDKTKPYVCLCRTNAFVFGETVEVIENNPDAKIFFEGSFQSYAFNNILDGWYFYKGQKVKNPLFNKFENFSKLLDYAKRINDLELLSIYRMIEKYGSSIPSIISNIKSNVITNRSLADIIFSTIHRSKGSTQNLPVYIADDVFDINAVFKKEYINSEKEDNFDIKNYEDESFVIYVAITRAFNNLFLPDKIKDYLITRYNYFKDNNKNI